MRSIAQAEQLGEAFHRGVVLLVGILLRASKASADRVCHPATESIQLFRFCMFAWSSASDVIPQTDFNLSN